MGMIWNHSTSNFNSHPNTAKKVNIMITQLPINNNSQRNKVVIGKIKNKAKM